MICTMRSRASIPVGVVRDGTAGVVPPEPLTLEAIERDPANAVRLELPEGASRELVERVIDAASDMQERYLAAAQLRRDGPSKAGIARPVRSRWRKATDRRISASVDEPSSRPPDRDPAKVKLVDDILLGMGECTRIPTLPSVATNTSWSDRSRLVMTCSLNTTCRLQNKSFIEQRRSTRYMIT